MISLKTLSKNIFNCGNMESRYLGFILLHSEMAICLRPLENTIQRTNVTVIINMSELDITKVRRWCRVGRTRRGAWCDLLDCAPTLRPSTLHRGCARRSVYPATPATAHLRTRVLFLIPFVSRQLVTSDLFETVS